MAQVTVNGAALAYDDEGSGDPPFLFLHGGLCNRTTWAAQVADLARDHRCVAFDHRGCGESEAVEPFDVTQQAADAAALAETLGLGPAIVVGHSMGGIAALLLNESHPDLVLGTVAIDAPIGPRPMDLEPVVRAITEAGSTEPLRPNVERMVAGAPEAVQEAVTAMMLGCAPAVAAGMLSGLGPAWERMPALVKAADQKPFMALWPAPEGEPAGASPGGSDPKWLREVTMFLRQEPVVVAGSGHFLHMERPDVTNALLRAFLDDVERDPRLDQ
jgi:pimeloyl-ACP methyl ester carboxylesterase